MARRKRVTIIGKQKKPEERKPCGCDWIKRPGAVPHFADVWTTTYDQILCFEHAQEGRP